MEPLKTRLKRPGSVTIGCWNQLGYPQTTEMLVRWGGDFMVVDMEHTSIGSHELLQSIQIADLAGIPALVRVGANDPLLIKRALDAGATGIIVPMIGSAEAAKRAHDAIYYPPKGARGVGLARAQGFGLDFDAYRDRADDRTLFIPQIEHHEAVKELDAILELDGVDGFLVGPYDLSGSLGRPGDFEHPEVQTALAPIREAAKHHPKPAGLHVVHPGADALKQRIEEGYRLIAYGTDMVFFAHMMQREAAVIGALRKDGEER